MVLSLAALRITDHLIGCDALAARFSGDEFSVLLRDTQGAAAADIAQVILDAIEQPMQMLGQSVSVSCSIGVVGAPAGADPVAVLGCTDHAMYQAKRAGRGRVVVEAFSA